VVVDGLFKGKTAGATTVELLVVMGGWVRGRTERPSEKDEVRQLHFETDPSGIVFTSIRKS
jgi:hypothetical protein